MDTLGIWAFSAVGVLGILGGVAVWRILTHLADLQQEINDLQQEINQNFLLLELWTQEIERQLSIRIEIHKGEDGYAIETHPINRAKRQPQAPLPKSKPPA